MLRIIPLIRQLLLLISLSSATPQRPAPKAAARDPPRADTATSLKLKTFDPPANLKSDLDATWTWIKGCRRDATTFNNWGWHQIAENGGYLNFCIRWESTTILTPELRKLVYATLNKQINKWIVHLDGFEGWPYGPEIPINNVGWAAKDRSLFPSLNETIEGKYYSDKDREGIPQCAEACGRYFHRNGVYSTCTGGKAAHYDQSYWLTDKFGGGAGGDWGERMQTAGSIAEWKKGGDFGTLLHEFGHSLALDDFYTWKPPGQQRFLMAGEGMLYISEFDAWMIRDWWRKLKPTLKLNPSVGAAFSV